eukprot:9485651-Pyramimonas_sp.AAC.1
MVLTCMEILQYIRFGYPISILKRFWSHLLPPGPHSDIILQSFTLVILTCKRIVLHPSHVHHLRASVFSQAVGRAEETASICAPSRRSAGEMGCPNQRQGYDRQGYDRHHHGQRFPRHGQGNNNPISDIVSQFRGALEGAQGLGQLAQMGMMLSQVQGAGAPGPACACRGGGGYACTCRGTPCAATFRVRPRACIGPGHSAEAEPAGQQ